MTYIRVRMSSKYCQIRSGTTELAALEHLKINVAPFSLSTVVFIPGKKSGERSQDHWSSVFDLVSTCCGISEERLGYCTFCKTETVCDRHVSFEVCPSIFLYKDC